MNENGGARPKPDIGPTSPELNPAIVPYRSVHGYLLIRLGQNELSKIGLAHAPGLQNTIATGT